MDHVIILPHSLQPIVENRVLDIDPDEVDQKDFMSSVDSMDEKTSLVRSGGNLSYSYTESIGRFIDTQDHDQRTLTVTEIEQDDRYYSSVITDFQASYFLPSLMLSSYSTIRQSYDQMARSIAQSMIKRSLYGSRSVAVSLIEKLSDDRGASFGLALFNLLPALLGSALFTLPYAVAIGGFATIPIFVIVSIMAEFTSLLLVDSMYEMSPKSKMLKRTKLDYCEIAEAAFGKIGSRIMNFILIFYLFSVNVVALVLIGKSFDSILRQHVSLSSQEIMASFSILVIPALFIQRLSHLAYLSMISVFAIIIGGLSTIVAFILQYNNWKHNMAVIPIFDWNGFALALSIWSFTIIPHTIIPQIESGMHEPAKFSTAVHTSFGLSTPIKILYAVLGALTYGAMTQSLVTNNIVAFSYPLSVVVNTVVIIFAICNFPLNFFVVCDAFDSLTLGANVKRASLKRGGKYHPLWILLTRPVLVGIGLGIGLVVPYFGLLVGVLGSLLGTLLVFLFPCALHLKLKWKSLSCARRLLEIIVMTLGCSIGCIGLYASVKGLYFAIQRKHS